METKKKICVIGGGRWGKNHIKSLYLMGNLGGIIESNTDRLNSLLDEYRVKGYKEIDDAINEGFDGYIVATPPIMHYPIGKKLLEKGLNVLIEKPMTLSSATAEELLILSEKTGGKLMVGHVLLFHPAIRKIKEVIDSGKIGNLYYIYSNRVNHGTVRTEENVFWSFAPHDISVIEYFVGSPPIFIESSGSKFLQKNVYDFTMTQLVYPNNVHAHIFVSWLHPFKEQRLVLVGSKGMISFDDSSIEKEIFYYQKQIVFDNGYPEKVEKPTEIIAYENKQPLSEELNYFVNNLDKTIEISNGYSGLEVVKVLEKAQNIIEKKQ